MDALAAPQTGMDFQDWVGRSERVSDFIAPDRVASLAATLDIDADVGPGRDLPPGWHWIFFNPFVRQSQLGVDGHPKRGGFLPPVPLPRRMWAGGRLTYLKGLVIGKEAIRTSVIKKIEAKSGKAGQLVFVTVAHTVSCNGADCIREEQDIVYREASIANAPTPVFTPAPDGSQSSWGVQPDTVLLFRYSALTSNGHRIHYDQNYACNVEHYPDLVVHGPLTATLLQNFASSIRQNAPLKTFEFRGVHPIFASARFSLEAKNAEGGGLDLWVRGPKGELAMKASATF